MLLKHQLIPYVVLGSTAMMLAGCGGGGSDTSAPTIPTSYTALDLSTLIPNVPNEVPNNQSSGLNNLGQVIGTNFHFDTTTQVYLAEGFLYSNGSVQDISHPTAIAPNFFYPTDINDKEQIIGSSNSSVSSHSIILKGTSVTDLTNFGGSAISNNGAVAGAIASSGTTSHLALYYNGSIQDLGLLPGFTGIYPRKINSSAQIVGDAMISTNGLITKTHGFLYSSNQLTDLGTLTGYTDSRAQGINNRGQVVGVSGNMTSDFTYSALSSFSACHAFLFQSGKMTDLGTLPGDDASAAFSINSSGQIVGASGLASEKSFRHAFLYSQGKMVNLDTLLPAGTSIKLSRAIAINDRGQILAQDYNGSGILLTPKS